MKEVIIDRFGGPEVMRVVEEKTSAPARGEVRVAVTSIGMNHAELMMRRGDYKLASGAPPFTPGLEAGGVIDAVGEGVTDRREGQRVVCAVQTFRVKPGASSLDGAYRSSVVLSADEAIPAPDAIPDDQLGAIWLPYLTAWGCLVWKHGVKEGDFVAIPAASSSVGLAAAQIVKAVGATPIGMTTSPEKVETLRAMPESHFAHIVVTRGAHKEARPWPRELKEITDGRGVDVFFDPVAAGSFLDKEIKCLAQGGVVYVYGLLGKVGPVDVSPLIARRGSIYGWILHEVVAAGAEPRKNAYRSILEAFEKGTYRQRVAKTFKLDDVQTAHAEMEKGEHIGKLVMVP